MADERRLMPRYDIALPIIAGDLRGLTRNLGVNGVAFVASAALRVDETITFSIVISSQPKPLTMKCTGVVKRVTRLSDGQYEIAATIDRLELDTAPRM